MKTCATVPWQHQLILLFVSLFFWVEPTSGQNIEEPCHVVKGRRVLCCGLSLRNAAASLRRRPTPSIAFRQRRVAPRCARGSTGFACAACDVGEWTFGRSAELRRQCVLGSDILGANGCSGKTSYTPFHPSSLPPSATSGRTPARAPRPSCTVVPETWKLHAAPWAGAPWARPTSRDGDGERPCFSKVPVLVLAPFG